MLLTSIVSVLNAQGGWGWHHAGWGGGGWWWLAGPLWLLFWLAILGVGTWLVVRTVQRRQPGPRDRARDILAERYARGEISSEEYRERLDQLG
jgi:putative membrane protein